MSQQYVLLCGAVLVIANRGFGVQERIVAGVVVVSALADDAVAVHAPEEGDLLAALRRAPYGSARHRAQPGPHPVLTNATKPHIHQGSDRVNENGVLRSDSG